MLCPVLLYIDGKYRQNTISCGILQKDYSVNIFILGDFYMDNLRRGILLFTAVLFLSVAVIGFILSLNYYDTKVEKESVPDWQYTGEKVTNDFYSKSESLVKNVLVIIGDKGVKESELMFVANYDTVDKTTSFIYVPKDVKYSLDVKNIPLSNASYSSSYNTGKACQLYSRFKGEDATKIVSYTLDVDIDYYLYLSFSDCEKLFDNFATYSLSFDVPVKLSNSELGISIEPGKQLFHGKKAIDLMRFYKTPDDVYDSELLKYYDGTDVKRIEMVKKLMNTFLSSQFFGENPYKSHYLNNFYKLAYEDVIKNCDTNIDGEYINDFKDLLPSLSSSSVSFYLMNCDVSGYESSTLMYTGCLKNFTSDDSKNHFVLSEQETEKVIAEKFY